MPSRLPYGYGTGGHKSRRASSKESHGAESSTSRHTSGSELSDISDTKPWQNTPGATGIDRPPAVIEDKDIAACAVRLVVNSSRKGVLPLCTDVARLIQSNAQLQSEVSKLQNENAQLKWASVPNLNEGNFPAGKQTDENSTHISSKAISKTSGNELISQSSLSSTDQTHGLSGLHSRFNTSYTSQKSSRSDRRHLRERRIAKAKQLKRYDSNRSSTQSSDQSVTSPLLGAKSVRSESGKQLRPPPRAYDLISGDAARLPVVGRSTSANHRASNANGGNSMYSYRPSSSANSASSKSEMNYAGAMHNNTKGRMKKRPQRSTSDPLEPLALATENKIEPRNPEAAVTNTPIDTQSRRANKLRRTISAASDEKLGIPETMRRRTSRRDTVGSTGAASKARSHTGVREQRKGSLQEFDLFQDNVIETASQNNAYLDRRKRRQRNQTAAQSSGDTEALYQDQVKRNEELGMELGETKKELEMIRSRFEQFEAFFTNKFSHSMEQLHLQAGYGSMLGLTYFGVPNIPPYNAMLQAENNQENSQTGNQTIQAQIIPIPAAAFMAQPLLQLPHEQVVPAQRAIEEEMNLADKENQEITFDEKENDVQAEHVVLHEEIEEGLGTQDDMNDVVADELNNEMEINLNEQQESSEAILEMHIQELAEVEKSLILDQAEIDDLTDLEPVYKVKHRALLENRPDPEQLAKREIIEKRETILKLPATGTRPVTKDDFKDKPSWRFRLPFFKGSSKGTVKQLASNFDGKDKYYERALVKVKDGSERSGGGSWKKRRKKKKSNDDLIKMRKSASHEGVLNADEDVSVESIRGTDDHSSEYFDLSASQSALFFGGSAIDVNWLHTKDENSLVRKAMSQQSLTNHSKPKQIRALYNKTRLEQFAFSPLKETKEIAIQTEEKQELKLRPSQKAISDDQRRQKKNFDEGNSVIERKEVEVDIPIEIGVYGHQSMEARLKSSCSRGGSTTNQLQLQVLQEESENSDQGSSGTKSRQASALELRRSMEKLQQINEYAYVQEELNVPAVSRDKNERSNTLPRDMRLLQQSQRSKQGSSMIEDIPEDMELQTGGGKHQKKKKNKFISFLKKFAFGWGSKKKKNISSEAPVKNRAASEPKLNFLGRRSARQNRDRMNPLRASGGKRKRSMSPARIKRMTHQDVDQVSQRSSRGVERQSRKERSKSPRRSSRRRQRSPSPAVRRRSKRESSPESESKQVRRSREIKKSSSTEIEDLTNACNNIVTVASIHEPEKQIETVNVAPFADEVTFNQLEELEEQSQMEQQVPPVIVTFIADSPAEVKEISTQTKLDNEEEHKTRSIDVQVEMNGNTLSDLKTQPNSAPATAVSTWNRRREPPKEDKNRVEVFWERKPPPPLLVVPVMNSYYNPTVQQTAKISANKNLGPDVIPEIKVQSYCSENIRERARKLNKRFLSKKARKRRSISPPRRAKSLPDSERSLGGASTTERGGRWKSTTNIDLSISQSETKTEVPTETESDWGNRKTAAGSSISGKSGGNILSHQKQRKSTSTSQSEITPSAASYQLQTFGIKNLLLPQTVSAAERNKNDISKRHYQSTLTVPTPSYGRRMNSNDGKQQDTNTDQEQLPELPFPPFYWYRVNQGRWTFDAFGDRRVQSELSLTRKQKENYMPENKASRDEVKLRRSKVLMEKSGSSKIERLTEKFRLNSQTSPENTTTDAAVRQTQHSKDQQQQQQQQQPSRLRRRREYETVRPQSIPYAMGFGSMCSPTAEYNVRRYLSLNELTPPKAPIRSQASQSSIPEESVMLDRRAASPTIRLRDKREKGILHGLVGCKCSRCVKRATKLVNGNWTLSVGDTAVTRGNQRGLVRYIGHLEKSVYPHTIYVGIELDSNDGDADGSFANKYYFHCKHEHGIFVPIENVNKVGLSDSLRRNAGLSIKQRKAIYSV